MRLKLFDLIISFCISFSAFSQTNNLIVQPDINLPKDSITSVQLISSLNNFLNLKDKPNAENNFVWESELVETFLLLDEMNGVEKSNKFKDDNFYKPYLINVVKLDESIYIVQISYIGINENTPLLRASFDLIAHMDSNQFYFASPLKRNSATWQNKEIGNYTFYFKNKLNEDKANEYKNTVSFFDKKLQASEQKTEIYCCNDFPDALTMVGVGYNSIYNGFNYNTNLSSQTTNKRVLVNASEGGSFNNFDPHDLWHERLHRVVSTDIINKPVDEGCAFLYGGSWGMSWEEILEKFHAKLGNDPETDWLQLYEEQFDFGENESKRLRINYFLNALIVQKLEKTKGFASVLELLTCGKYEKGNENYFKILEKVTGINKLNFNKEIWKLINESR